MARLRLGLRREGSVLFGMVLEQDEELRASRLVYKTIESMVGFKIRSCGIPELTDDALYIRGDCPNNDYNLFHYDYGSERAAVIAYNNIIELVKRINGPKQPEDEMRTYGLNVIE